MLKGLERRPLRLGQNIERMVQDDAGKGGRNQKVETCRLSWEVWPLSKVQWETFEGILNLGVVTAKILSWLFSFQMNLVALVLKQDFQDVWYLISFFWCMLFIQLLSAWLNIVLPGFSDRFGDVRGGSMWRAWRLDLQREHHCHQVHWGIPQVGGTTVSSWCLGYGEEIHVLFSPPFDAVISSSRDKQMELQFCLVFSSSQVGCSSSSFSFTKSLQYSPRNNSRWAYYGLCRRKEPSSICSCPQAPKFLRYTL